MLTHFLASSKLLSVRLTIFSSIMRIYLSSQSNILTYSHSISNIFNEFQSSEFDPADEPIELTVFIVGNDNNGTRITLPLCLWKHTTFWTLDTPQHPCTNILQPQTVEQYDYYMYFLLPFDSEFHSPYDFLFQTNQTLQNLQAALIIHPMTNFLSLCSHVNNILMPYYVLLSNSRFVFANNNLYSDDQPCPPKTTDQYDLDVIQFYFNGDIYLNCFDGFYSTPTIRSHPNLNFPETIFIGPLNGLIANISLINLDSLSLYTDEFNSKYIPPCFPITNPTASPSLPSVSKTPTISITPLSTSKSSSISSSILLSPSLSASALVQPSLIQLSMSPIVSSSFLSSSPSSSPQLQLSIGFPSVSPSASSNNIVASASSGVSASGFPSFSPIASINIQGEIISASPNIAFSLSSSPQPLFPSPSSFAFASFFNSSHIIIILPLYH